MNEYRRYTAIPIDGRETTCNIFSNVTAWKDFGIASLERLQRVPKLAASCRGIAQQVRGRKHAPTRISKVQPHHRPFPPSLCSSSRLNRRFHPGYIGERISELMSQFYPGNGKNWPVNTNKNSAKWRVFPIMLSESFMTIRCVGHQT